MAEIILNAETGRTTGSAESRRLRAAGRIPAVLYGHGGKGTSVSVDGRELRHALSGESGLNQLLSLQVGAETHLAMARSLQRHPVRHTVIHIDFLIVRRDEVISADVPIVLIGEAKTVEQEGGLVEHLLTALTVNAIPALIPPNIEVDISGLTVGDSVRVSDLPLPQGVTTDAPPEEIVVLASVTRAAAEETVPEAEEAEGGEGAGPTGGQAGAGSSGGGATPSEER